MKVRIISEIHELKALQDDWNDLFVLVGHSVFQSFRFNYSSWEVELSKNTLNKLCVIFLKTDEGVSAILPLYIDSRKRLRFINDTHADFCDILLREKFDFENILSAIRDQCKFNSIHFINLKEDSFLYDLFKKNAWKNSILKPFEKYSDLFISEGSFPNNVIRYTSKQKTEFRRVKKKNADNTYHLLSKENANFPIKEIYHLKEKMIELGLRNANFLDDDRLSFLKELFNSNIILVSIVRNNNVHAISFILRNNNEYLFWIDMYDNTKMINIFNYISFIESVSCENSVNINFGRGVYDYKILNFKPDIKQLFAVYLFKNKFQLISFLFMERIKNMVKLLYKEIRR